MHVPENVNYLAVLVAGIVIFLLGWLWYSVLCKNQWMALHGKTEAELKAPAQGSMAGMYISHLVASLIIAWVLAVILNHFVELDWMRGALVGVLFVAGATGASVNAASGRAVNRSRSTPLGRLRSLPRSSPKSKAASTSRYRSRNCSSVKP